MQRGRLDDLLAFRGSTGRVTAINLCEIAPATSQYWQQSAAPHLW
jgi:hypothetical protein